MVHTTCARASWNELWFLSGSLLVSCWADRTQHQKKNTYLNLNLDTSLCTMPQTELADFTTNDARPVVCQRCRESFEKGTRLYYMKDGNNPDGPGRHVCAGCREHYLRKTAQRTAGNIISAFYKYGVLIYLTATGSQDALLRQVTPETPRRNLSDPAVKNIRKAVADAQRRG